MSSITFQQYVCVVLMLIIGVFVRYNDANCTFRAIFNFGDSNSDTGSMPMSSPNGNTYFQKPSGRSSDGRLIIDFLGNSRILF